MRLAFLVTRREITEVLRDLNLVGPMIAMPSLMAFIAVLPLLGTAQTSTEMISIVAGTLAAEQLGVTWMERFLQLTGMEQGQLLGNLLKAMTLPLFWIVAVALTSTVAADSFVGEKERDTIEPLLATPITNRELFLGKLVSAVVPAVAGTWIGILIFSVGVWRTANPFFPRFLLADTDWLASTFIVVPLMAIMSAGVAALISSRVATYRAAYQLNGLIVLPIITFLVPQTVILFLMTPRALALLSSVILAVDVVLVYTALRTFNREQLVRGS
jgi:ABC-type Na+ efflux pump permease subunit